MVCLSLSYYYWISVEVEASNINKLPTIAVAQSRAPNSVEQTRNTTANDSGCWDHLVCATNKTNKHFRCWMPNKRRRRAWTRKIVCVYRHSTLGGHAQARKRDSWIIHFIIASHKQKPEEPFARTLVPLTRRSIAPLVVDARVPIKNHSRSHHSVLSSYTHTLPMLSDSNRAWK